MTSFFSILNMGWTYSDPFAGAEKQLAALSQRVCDETAEDVLQFAVAAAPRDKGALIASGYTANAHDSGAAEARAAALSKNPNAEMLDPVVVEDYSDNDVAVAIVDFLASYALFLRFGRHFKGGFRPGSDFLGIAEAHAEAAFHARAQRELDAFCHAK